MFLNITLKGHTFILVSDPNDINIINWNKNKELCIQHVIEFQNQTFVQFIKQLREQFLDQKNKRKYKQKSKKTNNCKTS